MKISVFTLIKNEVDYIGYCIMSILDYVDEFIYYDGNSTDGTIELIEYIKNKYDKTDKIKLFKNKDPKDLQDDYIKLFNGCLKKCTGDYIWFLHPDMIVVNPESIRSQIDGTSIRYNINMTSFAGNREHIITAGRSNKWATIFKNDFGLHFWGFYGHQHEDFYLRDITGEEHVLYACKKYKPYNIANTDIQSYHYCDTRPYMRRYDRMRKILLNNGYHVTRAVEDAKIHPRVTLESGSYQSQKFIIGKFIGKQPIVFDKYFNEFIRFKK